MNDRLGQLVRLAGAEPEGIDLDAYGSGWLEECAEAEERIAARRDDEGVQEDVWEHRARHVPRF